MSCPSSIKSDDFGLQASEDALAMDALTSDSLSWGFTGSEIDINSLRSNSSGLWSLPSEPDMAPDLVADTTAAMSAVLSSPQWEPVGVSSLCSMEDEASGYYSYLFGENTQDPYPLQPLMDAGTSPHATNPLPSKTDNEKESVAESESLPSSPLRHFLDRLVASDEESRATQATPQRSLSNHLPSDNCSQDALCVARDLDDLGSPAQVKDHDVSKMMVLSGQQLSFDHSKSILGDTQYSDTFGLQVPRQEDEDDAYPDTLYTCTRPRSKSWVMERIESSVADLLEALAQGRVPQLEIDSRGPSKAMTEFDPDQGIIRRRQPLTGAESVHGRWKQNPVEGYGSMGTVERIGTPDCRNFDEDEDLFEQYDDDDSNDTPTTLPGTFVSLNGDLDTMDIKVATTNSDAPLTKQQIKASNKSSQTKGTKVLRMTASGIKQLTSVIRIMDIIHESVQKDVYITKRDMYYRDVVTFRQQAVVDRGIDDLASTFKVPRSSLHVVAGTRGLVYGSIHLTTRQHDSPSATRDECVGGHVRSKGNKDQPKTDSDTTSSGGEQLSWIESSQPHPIPALEEVVRVEIHPRTRFVLVVEKEATIKYLISTNFCGQHGPCILLTGKGHPDRATRQLLNCLARMINLGVTVWHPNGIHEGSCAGLWDDGLQVAAAMTRHGSPQMAFDNLNLAVPQLRCLGQVPDDWFTCFDPGNSKTDALSAMGDAMIHRPISPWKPISAADEADTASKAKRSTTVPPLGPASTTIDAGRPSAFAQAADDALCDNQRELDKTVEQDVDDEPKVGTTKSVRLFLFYIFITIVVDITIDDNSYRIDFHPPDQHNPIC
ncbi:endodeoxyribonuclease [Actinomortierella ambigua]|uniref:DNA topoisomerase (ATP-hydrolyzing) n=1 Tax=Actinomortierella ambigua TaxID=1343610 RepID=A0A9P6QL74_9FUNG|nr:endodeoxyribonuclease [Actinomortierella ambigua]